jgi:NADH-quinone oxidoreductase subunit C
MATRNETLIAALQAALGDKLASVSEALGEVTAIIPAAALEPAMRLIRDRPELRFEELIDVCGVDYSTHGSASDGPRFAAVYHLLSLANNARLRVRAYATDDTFPVIPTMVDVWPGPTGTSARRSTSTASCSPATPICAAS